MSDTIYDKQRLAEAIASDPECLSGMWNNRVKQILLHLAVVDGLVRELKYWHEHVSTEELVKSPYGVVKAGELG